MEFVGYLPSILGYCFVVSFFSLFSLVVYGVGDFGVGRMVCVGVGGKGGMGDSGFVCIGNER